MFYFLFTWFVSHIILKNEIHLLCISICTVRSTLRYYAPIVLTRNILYLLNFSALLGTFFLKELPITTDFEVIISRAVDHAYEVATRKASQ